MATKFWIFPYRNGSRSARTLADVLNGKLIKRVNSRFRPNINGRVVINWGASNVPDNVVRNERFINPVEYVRLTRNKIDTFRFFSDNDLNTVEWTTDKSVAKDWLDNDDLVVIRTNVNGHGGDGIILCEQESDLVDAPLYTKYKKKKAEYRVHFSHSGVFLLQRKVASRGTSINEWRIRSYSNGFIFQNETSRGTEIPDCVTELANNVRECLNQRFSLPYLCAADIIWNKREDKAYVLELNSAPGISHIFAYYSDEIEKICKDMGWN